MVRTLSPASVLLVLVAMAGCKMCTGPLDDCGPVWSQGRCLNCDPDYRAGSVLNKGDGMGAKAQAAPPNVPNPMTDRVAAKPRSQNAERIAAAQRARRVDLAADEQPAPKKRPVSAKQPPRNVERVAAEQAVPKKRPVSAKQPSRNVERVAAEQAVRQPPRKVQRPPAPTEQWAPAREPNPVHERASLRQTERAPVGQTEPAPEGTAAGATRILSVTDRRLDEPATTDSTARELPAPPTRRTAQPASEMP